MHTFLIEAIYVNMVFHACYFCMTQYLAFVLYFDAFFIPRHRRRDIVLALSVHPSFCPSIFPSVRPALLCLEPYHGSALADFN